MLDLTKEEVATLRQCVSLAWKTGNVQSPDHGRKMALLDVKLETHLRSILEDEKIEAAREELVEDAEKTAEKSRA